MQKLFIKKERVLKKMDKCLRYLKQWVLRCPPEKNRTKKEMNKIAHVFLQGYVSNFKKRDMFSRSIVELG